MPTKTKSRPNPARMDPTRTAGLRRAWLVELRRRFRRVKALVRRLVEEDAFGLAPTTASPFAGNVARFFCAKCGRLVTNASFFESCPRDEKGRCTSTGGADPGATKEAAADKAEERKDDAQARVEKVKSKADEGSAGQLPPSPAVPHGVHQMAAVGYKTEEAKQAAMQSASREINRLAEKYPRLKAALGHSKAAVVLSDSKDVHLATGERVGAVYSPDSRKIEMGYKDSGPETLTLGKQNVGTGRDYELRHEMAHHLANVTREAGGTKDPEVSGFAGFNTALRADAGTADKAAVLRFASKKISKYASMNMDEAYAEAFAAYTSPHYKRGMLPKNVEAHFDKVLGAPTTNTVTNAGRYAFLSDADKLKAFQAWLAKLLRAEVLGRTEDELWRRYVEEGFKKGQERVWSDFKSKADPEYLAKPEGFFEGSREEFLRSSFVRPVAVEKVQLLTARVFTDLKGITDGMAASMTRVLADGLVQGQSPRDVGRNLADAIDISEARAERIARTETIRTHAEGQLQALEDLGVTEVGVQVEWLATADTRTCPKCLDMEGTVLKVEDAAGLIPLHPNCRCAWVPAGDIVTNRRRWVLNCGGKGGKPGPCPDPKTPYVGVPRDRVIESWTAGNHDEVRDQMAKLIEKEGAVQDVPLYRGAALKDPPAFEVGQSVDLPPASFSTDVNVGQESARIAEEEGHGKHKVVMVVTPGAKGYKIGSHPDDHNPYPSQKEVAAGGTFTVSKVIKHPNHTVVIMRPPPSKAPVANLERRLAPDDLALRRLLLNASGDSFFASCPRDEKGHCTSTGGADPGATKEAAKDKAVERKEAAVEKVKAVEKAAPSEVKSEVKVSETKPLSGPEQFAVSDYKSTGYNYINRSLREGADVSESTKKQIATLDRLVDQSPLAQDTTLHRVIDGKRFGDKYMKPGAVVEDKAFMSTATDPQAAYRAVKDANEGRAPKVVTTIEIRAPAGTKAFDLQAHAVGSPLGIAPQGDEKEVLLGRGTKLRVVSVDPEKRHVVAEIVNY